MTSVRRCTCPCAILVALAVGLAAPRAAHAESDRLGDAMTWGVLGLEAGTAGLFTLAFTTGIGSTSAQASVLGWTPLLLGGGITYLAYRADAGRTIPVVIHGAVWTGVDLFLVGTLLEGRNDRDRLKIGKVSLAMGVIGGLGGAALAEWTGRDKDASTVWLGAPVGSALAGGLVLGGILVLAGGVDGDKAVSQLATGTIAGLTLGLGASIYYGVTHPHRAKPPAAVGQVSVVPGIQVDHQRTVISFSGTF